MYALAIAGSVAAGSVVAFPHFQLGSLDIGIPIQSFGVIVAAGVLIGAAILRRYAEWHGVSDEHIRGILGWITIAGFLGAHWFDVLAYEPHKLDEVMATWPPSKWPVLLRIWDGISSYGGFVGGAVGFAVYVWWKRLPIRLFADISIIGLLPAFSIGRIGCTVVSDHVGSVVDKANWYAFLAMNYPANSKLEVVSKAVYQVDDYGNRVHASLFDPATGKPLADATITMWNLGLIEFMYLIPVNAVILWLAFRASKRMPAGFLAVLAGILYAPVRFFLDYLRPSETDARHAGLTFAQWCSLIAFGVSVYVISRILKKGEPAETVTRTSKEAQERLKVLLKEDEERAERDREEERELVKAGKDKKAAKDKAEDKADKKPAKDKADEVPPTEMDLEALPKDIVKKAADKKAADKKPDEKPDDKKPDDKKAEKPDDKKPDDKKPADKKPADKKA